MTRPQSTLQKIRAGHHRDWTRLHRHYYPRLVGYFRRHGLAEQAEDLASDVIRITLKSRSRLRSERAIPAWIFMTAANLVRKALHARRRQVAQLTDVAADDREARRREAAQVVHEELGILAKTRPALAARVRAWLDADCDSSLAADRFGCSRRSIQTAVKEAKVILVHRLAQ